MFSFQAEDGIRDFHVTGVQTCALPISREADGADAPPVERGAVRVRAVLDHDEPARARELEDGAEIDRSEERRGGKGWRSRWPPRQRNERAPQTPRGDRR